jgi:CRP/FNR family transcriptional regulator
MTALSRPLPDPTPSGQPQQPIQGDKFKLQSSLTDELALGRKQLNAVFRTLPPRTLKRGELLVAPAGYRRAIFRLRAGWTCQFRHLSNGRTVIIDVYLPGDVIGLDTVLRTQTLHGVLTLTSVILEVIPTENGLLDMIADRSIALYIFWLIGQRQRRADRRLAANTRLEAEARLAMTILDFYTQLRRRELITTATYNLPLTQTQIGDYVGLSAVHVNRVLRSLRDERVVIMENNCVTILDLKRLRKLAYDEGG